MTFGANLSGPAACRFFTPDDAVRWALQAYYGACRDVVPPKGQPWLAEGVAWSSPACWGDAVVTRFMAAVVAAAIDARVPCDHGCATPSFSWDDSAFYSRPQVNDLPGAVGMPQHEAASEVRRG
jgi:hypothetical protein